MSIKIGIVGVGDFAQCFIPLFMAHPLVKEVAFCDSNEQKLHDNSGKYGVKRLFSSLEELLSSDVDAVAIFTQNWLHAPQATQALRAGKHVYSAVPTGITVEEVTQLVEAVELSGNIYMLGETSYYYPAVLYCREQYGKGAFGHIAYAEAEYYHDWDFFLYDVAQRRGGDNWLETAGIPPMHYPTHSVSQIVSVTGAHMKTVSAQGFADRADDGIYRAEVNRWNNTFSNQAALFSMSDGSICRINEFRRVGHPPTERMSVFGTEASFQYSSLGPVWITRQDKESAALAEAFACRNYPVRDHPAYRQDASAPSEDGRFFVNVSKQHPVERLPLSFAGLPNEHYGAHQYLVDDFVKACISGKLAANHVWDAARYVLPGLVAHESSVKGGLLLEVPDFGDAPAFYTGES